MELLISGESYILHVFSLFGFFKGKEFPNDFLHNVYRRVSLEDYHAELGTPSRFPLTSRKYSTLTLLFRVLSLRRGLFNTTEVKHGYNDDVFPTCRTCK